MSNVRLFQTNVKRTALTDYFVTVGGNVSRDTTTKDANSDASLKLVYNSGTNQTFNASCNQYIGNTALASGWRKKSVTFRFYFTAIPAQVAELYGSNDTDLALYTDGTLHFMGFATAVLSINTWYTVELIADKDWYGWNNGAAWIRINQGTPVGGSVGSVAPNAQQIFGYNFSKVTGPATTIYLNHIVIRYSDDGTKKAPWLNNAKVEQNDRVPIANGADNDFTGVSQATNKYQNVDDSPSNTDTDYNTGGNWNSTKKQTYTTTAVTYGTTPRGWVAFNLVRAGDGQYDATQDYYTLVRENSTDTAELMQSYVSLPYSDNTYVPNIYGREDLPSSTAITTTNLNNLEIGIQAIIPAYNTSVGQNRYMPAGADGPTYNAQWSSTGANKYSVIQDGSDTTYITSTTAGFKQSISSFAWGPIPATQNMTFGIRYNYKVANVTTTDSGNQFRIGVRIGGVDYPEDHTITIQSNVTSQSSQQNMTWSGSFYNPATGVPWTQSDYTNAEFYIEHVQKGTTNGMQCWELTFFPLTRSMIMNTASFLVVNEGDAPTDNGSVPLMPQPFIIKQAVNRGSTY